MAGIPPRNVPWQDDPDIRRWQDNLATRSQNAANSYNDYLSRFLEQVGKTPPELVDMPTRARDDLVQDYVTALRQRKLSSATLKAAKCGIAPWLDFNGQQFGRRINTKGVKRPRASRYELPVSSRLAMVLNVAFDGSEVGPRRRRP